MSAGRLLTVGLGTPFSAVKYLVTLGLGTSGAPPTPAATGGTGGALWAKGRGKLNLRRRPLTYSETEELAARLQAIAAERAAKSIPMDRISDADGHVIGDDPFDDDDVLLQAALLRLLH